jgi:hypothetical protein
MATIAVATRQTAWNCRWSRTGARITDLPDGTGPETPWVCIKHGRRNIGQGECEHCPEWELIEEGPPDAHQREAARRRSEAAEMLRVGFRIELFIIAAVIVTLGVMLLTRPAVIPITILSFAVAAGLITWAVLGRLAPE